MRKCFSCLAVMIIAVFLLTGCATTQTSGSATSTPSTTTNSSNGTRHVKGINGWEGEISGTPAKDSKFNNLQIGMSMKQVMDLIGLPTDRGSYITGKGFIPFYYGSDTRRTELVYKDQGRLVFAESSRYFDSENLIMIINNAQEGGYR